ncbi:hypothetical protein FA09DRAFT_328844 [Tilletiopsis washingtonensis]|jgi:hypothetical protein|uniref:Uncharacterized protein n=1 Tax=Tilletiopsis washingtonensis TaxID=58919 RepID=A0A316ZEK4_9BASI|nr:hypothetical protein FA09DRAFT_328844 [Tilletiopsis washingtonensis]PWN99448.1 hypothetical protein FA09DRAFT_328844 [Tilletiopsis washingtonensis]
MVFFYVLFLAPIVLYLLSRRLRLASSPARARAYDPKTGLGRGAPGFQTNVARVAVPAHIVARIRAGEEVSAEEITRAQDEARRMREKQQQGEEEEEEQKKGGKRRKGKK